MSTYNDSTGGDPRQKRGLHIASKYKLRQKGNVRIVPSEATQHQYTVDPDAGRCTCPDHAIRRAKCKHIWAVEFQIKQEVKPDGTRTVTKTVRLTYAQNWPAYNAAQITERDTFLTLLHDLCSGIDEPAQTFGRPRLPLADIVFTSVFKVYSIVSGRRFMCDLADAHGKGLISQLPKHSSLFRYFEMPALTPILRDLITESSLPVKAIEADFAADSSGFSTSGTVTWFNKRYGHIQDNNDWVKMHLMVGVTTNVVTAVEITGGHASDMPQLPALVEATARNFRMHEVSADKGYSSIKNLRMIAGNGAAPYIPFKVPPLVWVRAAISGAACGTCTTSGARSSLRTTTSAATSRRCFR